MSSVEENKRRQLEEMLTDWDLVCRTVHNKNSVIKRRVNKNGESVKFLGFKKVKHEKKS